MRHRIGIANQTGLGNSSQPILDNKWTKKDRDRLDPMLKEAVELFFSRWGYCDLFIGKDEIRFGVEPAYQYDRLKIISISKKKDNSYFETGKAWGAYGSQLVRKRKYYKEYIKNGKFKKFIDKWYNLTKKEV